MQDADIEQRFHLMQKEIEAAVSVLKDVKLNLTATVDSLRIEVEVLKSYMAQHHPAFAETYSKLRGEAVQAIDPEWLPASESKQ